ncbi:MAG: hypothetical protein Q4G22_07245 [Paracoccus sp. (in: a-proteobacteria)]|uniref:hypothetical protein n=1 Tax=Paracoccus sp. TaxID=267 RepID=UPI0026DEEDDA|nr:hypothetical protein [Paracoccus sp. (in: a-proteobacteria)]MDO5631617.1 hypothetical protein [Paracoccus sp. (in: a-proteobacteria)]
MNMTFQGFLAFVRGLDRSPGHDRDLCAALIGLSNDDQVQMVRQWEAGWIAADEMRRELKLELYPESLAALETAQKIGNARRAASQKSASGRSRKGGV